MNPYARAHAPQTCLSACSSTAAYKRFLTEKDQNTVSGLYVTINRKKCQVFSWIAKEEFLFFDNMTKRIIKNKREILKGFQSFWPVFLWKKVAFTVENQVDKCGKIKEKLLKSKADMWKTQWKV